MARLSEQLEREAEGARSELALALGELRRRMTPRQIVDEVIDYARQTPLAAFAGNLVRDIREHPLPLLLIAAGIAWAVIASSRPPMVLRTGAEVPSPLPARPVRAASVGRRDEWETAAVTPAAG